MGGIVVLDSVDVGSAVSETAHGYQLSMAPGVVREGSAASERMAMPGGGEGGRPGGGVWADWRMLPEHVLIGGNDADLERRARGERNGGTDEVQEWFLWKALPPIERQGEKGSPEAATGSSAS